MKQKFWGPSGRGPRRIAPSAPSSATPLRTVNFVSYLKYLPSTPVKKNSIFDKNRLKVCVTNKGAHSMENLTGSIRANSHCATWTHDFITPVSEIHWGIWERSHWATPTWCRRAVVEALRHRRYLRLRFLLNQMGLFTWVAATSFTCLG